MNTFETLYQTWTKRQRQIRAAAAVFVAALGFAGVLLVANFNRETVAIAAAVAASLGATTYMAERIKHPVTSARGLAKHLNAVLPGAEESMELLLGETANAGLLERLQTDRVSLRLEKAIGGIKLPGIPYRMWVYGAVAMIVSMGISIMIALGGESQRFSPAATTRAVSEERKNKSALTATDVFVDLQNTSIEIKPPVYTALPQASQSVLNIQTAEGATAVWRLTFTGEAESVRLIFNQKDTLQGAAISRTVFTAEKVLTQQGFYTVEWTTREKKNYRSSYAAIALTKDLPPAIVIDAPDEEIIIEPASLKPLVLKAAATDDYGLTSATLTGTITQGTGEAVKFKTITVPLSLQKGRKRSMISAVIDPRVLGLGSGDEFYYTVEVADNHQPSPQQGRSPAHRISVRDTSVSLSVASASLGVSRLPEYFTSQRQIIIDTEKLLRDKPKLSEREFNRISDDIGIDQKILRLRYGKFLGEEFETAIGPHQDEDEGGSKSPDAESSAATSPADIMRPYTHLHDSEENATLFADDVKAMLKASLAQMWESELRLRTHRPKEALPFERNALKLLKEVQQQSRLYVQRVGAELPPLSPIEKRLTGDLGKIKSITERDVLKAKEPFAAIRKAMPVLTALGLHREETGLKSNALPAPEQPVSHPPVSWPVSQSVLRDAASELAAEATGKPQAYLPALQAMNRIIADTRRARLPKPEDVRLVLRACWMLLPESRPQLSSETASPSPYAERYFSELSRAARLNLPQRSAPPRRATK
ncbi:MAG: hypothetical protein IAF08_11660 [Rhizobacter sp.]|nr:hypothetical protein [Chlorobiales bacterium]